ncbi:MAG: hypothetical protein FRX49_12862 [Trebouxia sp. A1-2]|nr:MAG: hypothetical protein FRX49_12862 [Trebouxia sp. A1-2]
MAMASSSFVVGTPFFQASLQRHQIEGSTDFALQAFVKEGKARRPVVEEETSEVRAVRVRQEDEERAAQIKEGAGASRRS